MGHWFESSSGSHIHRSTMYTSSTLKQILDSFPLPSRIWVAYSGGLDSHVLLHSLACLRKHYPNMQLQAVHVHHGLNMSADAWSEHCQRVCRELSIDCTIKYVDPNIYNNKSNIEATARQARYQLLAPLLAANDYLVTAHHRDDQAETVLLRLLRGTGPNGLSAMAKKRSLGQGSLVRPLLDTPRADLMDYAKREQLQWIEDDSNTLAHFRRNFLRQQIFPQLNSRWSNLANVLTRTAQHCREAQQLAEQLAEQDFAGVQGTVTNTLSISALKKLSPARQKNVMRYWIKRLNFSLPSSKKLSQILQDGLTATHDAQPLLTWGQMEVRRFRDDLYLMQSLPAHDARVIIPWNIKQPCEIPGIGRMIARQTTDASGVWIADKAKITVRFRSNGERFHAAGRSSSHPLKKLFQEWHVPPWLRDRVPLLYSGEKLIAVVGYAVTKNLPLSTTSEKNVEIVLEKIGV